MNEQFHRFSTRNITKHHLAVQSARASAIRKKLEPRVERLPALHIRTDGRCVLVSTTAYTLGLGLLHCDSCLTGMNYELLVHSVECNQQDRPSDPISRSASVPRNPAGDQTQFHAITWPIRLCEGKIALHCRWGPHRQHLSSVAGVFDCLFRCRRGRLTEPCILGGDIPNNIKTENYRLRYCHRFKDRNTEVVSVYQNCASACFHISAIFFVRNSLSGYWLGLCEQPEANRDVMSLF